MRTFSKTRLAVAVAATVGVMIMSAGIVSASPPRWVMSVTQLPATVTNGSTAGFRVVIGNQGPSNISALFLVSDSTATPTYLTSSRPGTCNELGALSGAFRCSFGALRDGESVTVVVGYGTPTSGGSFPVTFQANTTGTTFSDVNNRSHGDLLTTAVTTGLSTDRDFAGLFSTANGGGIKNNDQLNGNNKQSTGVSGLPAGIEATVQDGPGATGSCTSTPQVNCNTLFGEWSVVNVGEGQTFAAPFVVTIKFKTGTPTGFVHSYGDPVQQELIGPCPAGNPAASAPCFTWNGGTKTASIYTLHNGSYKGR